MRKCNIVSETTDYLVDTNDHRQLGGSYSETCWSHTDNAFLTKVVSWAKELEITSRLITLPYLVGITRRETRKAIDLE